MKEPKIIGRKNVPLVEEESIQGVRRWLRLLEDMELMWHMDDTALDIVWRGKCVPEFIATTLESQRIYALDICRAGGVNIWDLVSSATKIGDFESFVRSRQYVDGPMIEELALDPKLDCFTPIMVYGSHEDVGELIGRHEDTWPTMAFLEWRPPLNGTKDNVTEHPEWARYDGYWNCKALNTFYNAGELRKAERALFNYYLCKM